MRKINLTDLLIFVITAELTGALSAIISGNFTDFYAQLHQPPFSPPSIVFPFVWTVLYALMGVSAYMVWLADTLQSKRAVRAYISQLAVNFSWSIIFFRFKELTLAAFTAVLLAVLVATMIFLFCKVNKKAAYLQLPYMAWSIFAAYLAVGTALLN